MQVLLETCPLTVTLYLTFWFHLHTLLKMARHNNVKIYNTFNRENLHVLFATIPVNLLWILISRYYRVRGRTNMNYAKKVVIFITMHIFHKENLIR